MVIKLFPHSSETYQQMVSLRHEILRKPLGLSFTLEELAKDQHDLLVGAFEYNTLMGCAILTQIDHNYLKIRQMLVNQSVQGKGVGKSILIFAENYAKENGYSHLFMNARISAIGFYGKSGYHVVGGPFEEVGIRHYRMEKVL